MTYQFPCPEGHLLEAVESAAGQRCSCPTCGTEFVIPRRPADGAPPVAAPPVMAPPPARSDPGAVEPRGGEANGAMDTQGSVVIDVDTVDPPPAVLHIPCPNGHELESPREMLDQYVMCPHCGVQYRLREENSLEHQRKKQREDEARQWRLGKAWLNWSVLIAVFVLLGLLTLMLYSTSD
jgi:hypothetical protein